MSEKKDTIILSDKDNISSGDALKLINHFKEDERTGLLVSEEYIETKKDMCGFCGLTMKFQPKGQYFGEIFHDECCRAMLRGETNR